MVTLTTDLGEFQAETPEEAAKMARKAVRDAAREEKRKEAARKTALVYARENGFRVYDRLADGDPPCGWVVHTPGNGYFPPQHPDDLGIYTHTRVDHENGSGEIVLYDKSWAVIGSLENGAGFTMLLWIQDRQNGDIFPHAVGVWDGVAVCERMAKMVTMERFRSIEKEHATAG